MPIRKINKGVNMSTITKKIIAVILAFAIFSSLFAGNIQKNAKAEENGQKGKIEWQMFLKERNHTNIANPMEIGIFDPVIKWDKGIDVISWGTTIGNFAENIEGDYNKDTSHVVFIYDSSDEDENGNDKVLCIADGDGETMWEWYFDDKETKTTPALAYLDDDSKLDIIFGANNGTIFAIEPVIYYEEGEYDVKNESEFLWDYKTNLAFTESSPTIADLNDDGVEDVLIGGVKDDKNYLLALNGENGKLIGKKELKGNLISTPAVMGRQAEYVVVTTYDDENEKLYVYCYDSLINEKVLKKSFSSVTSWYDYIIPSPTIVDLDNDGDLDIIIAFTKDTSDGGHGEVHAFDILGNTPEHWNDVSIKGHIDASLAIGDKKIVVQSYYRDGLDFITVLTVLNYKGEVIWKTEYNTDSGSSTSLPERAMASPILADLNEDGILDIISATTPNVVAYDGNSTKDNVEQLWALDLNEDNKNHNLLNSPSAGNINGDNLLDVVIDGAMITTKIPDLYIEQNDIKFLVDGKEREVVDEGDEVKIKATVHNKGSEKAENVIVRFFCDNKQIGKDQKIKEILDGGKSFAEINWDTAGEGGERYIKVVLDPNNNIKEANENNNKARRKIEVREPYKVKLYCVNNESNVDPGNTAIYEIEVKNEGSRSDEIELTYSKPQNENWKINLNKTIIELSSEDSEIVTLSVTPPKNALANEKSEITVFGTSKKDNHHTVPSSDSIKTTTTVNAVYGVELSCKYNKKKVNPNYEVNYKIEVKNTGNVEDTIKMQITNQADWDYELSSYSLELPAFSSKIINLKVKGENSYVEGKEARIIVKGVSKNDENKSSSVETITKISQLMCDNFVQEVFPTETANFTIGITNFGNEKTIELNRIGGDDWNTNLSKENVTLKNKEHTKVYLIVEIPKNTEPFDYREVAVTGNFTSGKVSIKLLTIARPYYEVKLSNFSSKNQSIYPGNSTNYLINVKNNGTALDTIKLSYVFVDKDENEIKKPKDWTVKFEKDEVSLGPTTSELILVNVTASTQAIYGEHFIKIIGTSEGNNSKNDSLVIITFIRRIYAINLSCQNNKKYVDPGKNTFYIITIKNKGNYEEIVNLTIDYSNSPKELVINAYLSGEKLVGREVRLAPYEQTNITLYLTISNDFSIAYANAKAIINLNGTLLSNLEIKDNVTTITTINQIFDIKLICEDNEKEVFPDAFAKYSIELENNGNGGDSVDFSYIYIDDNGNKINKIKGWNVIINGSSELKNVTVGREGKTTISLNLVAPPIDHQNAKEGFTVRVKLIGISKGIDVNPNDNEIVIKAKVKQVYGIELNCKYREKNVIPEEFVTYKITIVNKGNGRDTFYLDLKNENEYWFAEIVEDLDSVTLDGYGEQEIITLKVTAPEPKNTHYGEIAEITLIAKSKNGTADEKDDIYSNITTKTKIAQLMCEDNEHNLDPGEKTTYEIKIMNVGNKNDVNIALSISDIVDINGKVQDGWNASLSKDIVRLKAWESTSVFLNITAPPKEHENAFAGNTVFVNVTGKTPKYGGREDTIMTITKVNLVFDVELECKNPKQSVDVSKITDKVDVFYKIKVWNRGNGENQILFEVLTVANQWNFSLEAKDARELGNSSAEFILRAGEFAEAKLTLEVPYDALAGTYETKVRGSPVLGDIDKKDTLTLLTVVEPFYKLNFVEHSETIKILEGESKTHIVTLRNNGNAIDNISLELLNIPSSWTVLITPKNIELSAHESYDFTLKITVPMNTKVNIAILLIKAYSKNDRKVIGEMQLIVNVELLPNPDIFVQDIKFSDYSPKAGDIVTIIAQIKNKGEKIAENFEVVFYLDNKEIFNTTISVGSGEGKEVKYEWQATKGEHEIKVIADFGNKIFESDEDNNELTKSIIVGEEERTYGILPFGIAVFLILIIALLYMKRTGKLDEFIERVKKTEIEAKKEFEEEEEIKEKKGVTIKLDEGLEKEKGVFIKSEEEIYTSCPECGANIKVPDEEEFKCPICKAVIEVRKEEEKTTFPVITNCLSCNAKIKIKKAGKFECPKCKTTIVADENGKISEVKKVFPLITNCPSCNAKIKINRYGELKCPKCKTGILVDEDGNVKEKEEEVSIFPLVSKCPACGSRIKISKPGTFKCPRCETTIEVGIEGKIKEKKVLFPLITNCPSCNAKIRIKRYGILRCPKCKKRIEVDEEGNVKLRKIELEEGELEF